MDRLTEPQELPLIPLREVVAFPSAVIQILVGRERSVKAFQYAMDHENGLLILSAQKNQLSEYPAPEEICPVGILARVRKVIKQSDHSYRLTIRGLERRKLLEIGEAPQGGYYRARLQKIPEEGLDAVSGKKLGLKLLLAFRDYLANRKIKLQGVDVKFTGNNIAALTDIIASVIRIPPDLKQALLEEFNVYHRVVRLLNILKEENKKFLQGRETAAFFEKGEEEEDDEIKRYKQQLKSTPLPEEVKEKLTKEIQRLEAMPAFSAEGSVIRYYIDWIFSVPWMKYKDEEIDMDRAERILEKEHYGLEKVKERILDYLAVRILKNKPDGEIICLVGPPGVGKSSLSRSVAHAMGREFVRMSLGGVKDEAEIRGHRRTYIGAYPGQIVKGLKQAKCMNPVFLLDEIDKIDSNFKGDPASALMEVLDPELNTHFVDHYLDLEIDLSKVFFITTANLVDTIPPPLRDRLEIIEIPGYTEFEKAQIALRYLVKKQAEKKGLVENQCRIRKPEILQIINHYTREAGVRELERQIAIIMRKMARKMVKEQDRDRKLEITRKEVGEFLGVPRYSDEEIMSAPEVGVAIGLAWTQFGGEILLIESRSIKGKGELILTGRLGEIMKESSSTAFSFVKLKLYEMGFDVDEIDRYNYHLHIPKGAVPKEGPSAGVTLAVSLISLITGVPVRNDLAMTGEITLRGKVLPVGGIREKVIAAHRYGIGHVLIPYDNKKEFMEYVSEDIQKKVKVSFVGDMDDVLRKSLTAPIKIGNIRERGKTLDHPEIQ